MRRASTCVAVIGMAFMALAGVASAAPTVTLKAKAIPIPGFPHTGNILGAGADVTFTFNITGNEYGGYPPPVIGLNLFFPKGAKINSSAFPTCSNKVLIEELTPEKCPKGSKAGHGTANGFVVFGAERVPETVSIEPFFGPGGAVNTFLAGHTPASIEKVTTGKFTSLGGAAGYGPELKNKVPLIETVPGAPAASATSFTVTGGAAIKKHGKTSYYGTLPKKCPKGGFPVKAEVIFAENGNEATPLPVIVNYKATCPRK